MVSKIKPYKDDRLLDRRKTTYEDQNKTERRQRRGSKTARRFYSARPPSNADRKDNNNVSSARSSMVGPRCTTVPLRKKHHFCCIQKNASRIRSKGENAKSGNAPFAVKISLSFFTEVPIPPATSPVESICEISDYGNCGKTVKENNGLSKSIEKENVSCFCNAQPLESARKEVSQNLSRRKVSVLKFEADEVIQNSYPSEYRCHWKSSLGSLRPRSSVSSSRPRSSSVCLGLRSSIVHRLESNDDGKKNRLRRPKSSAARLEGCGASKSNIVSWNTALKVRKYSYNELEKADAGRKQTKMIDKDACRNVFLLSHKGLQKYTLHTSNADGTKSTKLKRNKSLGNELIVEKKSSGLKAIETPMTFSEKQQLMENIVSKSKIDTKCSLDAAICRLEKNISKAKNILNGVSERTLGTVRSSFTNSPFRQGVSTRSRNSSSTAEGHAFDHIIYDEDADNIPKQRLLPQNQIKKNLKLHVSDIIATVDSIKKVEKCRYQRILEFEKQRKSTELKEKDDAKKRRLLKIHSRTQKVWQRSAVATQVGSNLKFSSGGGKSKSFNKTLSEMDDRLGKTTEDAAYIMRKRDKMTSELLQKSDLKDLMKEKRFKLA